MYYRHVIDMNGRASAGYRIVFPQYDAHGSTIGTLSNAVWTRHELDFADNKRWHYIDNVESWLSALGKFLSGVKGLYLTRAISLQFHAEWARSEGCGIFLAEDDIIPIKKSFLEWDDRRHRGSIDDTLDAGGLRRRLKYANRGPQGRIKKLDFEILFEATSDRARDMNDIFRSANRFILGAGESDVGDSNKSQLGARMQSFDGRSRENLLRF